MNSVFHIDKLGVNAPAKIENSDEKDQKVCVVSVIGKSRLFSSISKATSFNSFLNANIFKGFSNNSWVELDSTCRLEGYYDAQSGVVFLNLLSGWDTSVLGKLARQVEENGTPEFLSVWRSSEYSYTRALLFVFSVSHIVVLAHPSASFDISYIRLFKTLDTIRLKIQPAVSEMLKRLPISKDWMLACRPCSPRVLFTFESPSLDPQITDPESPPGKAHSQKSNPVKELQHTTEDQIYRILRKSRIITNTSNNSLFAVPQNQEFVFIHPKPSSTRDLVNIYLAKLHSSCAVLPERVASRSKSYQLNRKQPRADSTDNPESRVASASRDASATAFEFSVLNSGLAEDEEFSTFLGQHVNLALTKGFDDNVGRNPMQAVFELPALSTWFAVVKKLHSAFWSDNIDGMLQTHFTTMKSMLDIDIKFSDGHCKKVLPLAQSAYSDGLPLHYTLAYHTNKLQEAANLFLQHARGPACEKYIIQLKDDCTQIWQNGRQMCEEISLTGNHCVNELHRLPDMPEMEGTKHLPVMLHSSQIKTKCACNCGQRLGERDDPFEHRVANYDFYQRLEQQCCGKLEHYEMTVFNPSTTEVRPAETLAHSIAAFVTEPESPTIVRKDSSKFDLALGTSTLSLAMSLGQSDCSDIFMHNSESAAIFSDNLAEDEDAGLSMNNEDEDDGVVERQNEAEALTELRQHSTTEYLPGMLHTDSLPGLLPKFPSWSLVLLGKYSLYNPAQGIDQPGFILPSNFLLPLDVTIRTTTGWMTGNEGSIKKSKVKKPLKDVAQIVRLYVGIEYECSRGHRFFLSSPDRVFKAPANGIFKETGHKVVNHDMPLYFPCSCRTPAQYISQLMRIHLAIPDGDFEVKLRPKVQPGPAPCPFFFPEASDCLLLRPGFWVLRLPFIYMGETGPYRMPADHQQLTACRFLKGFLSVTEGT